MDYIRPLDMSKFDPDNFTVQTLASRETDSNSCLFRVARMPAPRLSEEQHIHAMDKVLLRPQRPTARRDRNRDLGCTASHLDLCAGAHTSPHLERRPRARDAHHPLRAGAGAR